MTKLDAEFFPPPSGPLARLTKPAAVLRLTPAELSERLGLHFHDGYDDLDAVLWARVTGLSGRPYALVHHRHSPQQGTQVVVPYDSLDVAADLNDVLRALRLSSADVAWTSADVVGPARSRQQAGQRGPVRNRELVLKVPNRLAARLGKARGRGGVPALLRRLEKRVKGTELAVTSADVEKLLSYSAGLGAAPSTRTTPAQRKSTRKSTRKK